MIANKYSGHKAEDVTQLVFERLIENEYRLLDRFSGSYHSFLAYLNRIARNVALSDWRREQAHHSSVCPDPKFKDIRAAMVHQPDEIYLREETLSALEAAVMELKPTYREVYLHLFEGFNHREVATIMHIPLPTVLTRASRAREILRRELGQIVA